MERDEFIRLLGTAGLAACAGCALQSCEEDDPSFEGPTGVDFTLDLTLMENAALLTDGGFIYKSGVIVVCLSASTGNYTAVSQAYTHQGTTLVYQPANGNFYCSNHGSRFSVTGTVINGPASRALRKYNTVLVGANLRVFS
jgi:cytochrome b6-f complex iron-sulfur subunit